MVLRCWDVRSSSIFYEIKQSTRRRDRFHDIYLQQNKPPCVSAFARLSLPTARLRTIKLGGMVCREVGSEGWEEAV